MEEGTMKSCSTSKIRRYGTILVLLGIVAFVTSCSESDCVTGCDNCGGLRATPDDLLSFLEEAFEGKNTDAYGEALHDYFEFEFIPENAESLGLPSESPWWGKTRDTVVTRYMFDDPAVAGIEMGMSPFGPSAEWVDCSRRFIHEGLAVPETTLVHGLCMSLELDIKVNLEETGEEPMILWVHDTVLDVMVTPDPGAEGQWVIIRIKEWAKVPLAVRGSAPPSSREWTCARRGEPYLSWGALKVYFSE
jgi:hypothetical protein